MYYYYYVLSPGIAAGTSLPVGTRREDGEELRSRGQANCKRKKKTEKKNGCGQENMIDSRRFGYNLCIDVTILLVLEVTLVAVLLFFFFLTLSFFVRRTVYVWLSGKVGSR